MRPIVLIPGIKGTELVNTYPINHDITWSDAQMLVEDIYQLALSADGATDAHREVLHRPWQGFNVVYKQLFDHLRGRLKVPVYVFGYDWRLSNRVNAGRLAAFLRYLHDKLGHAADDHIDVVTHSMGGLILRAAVKAAGGAARNELGIGRVVFMATPHHGALDAVEAMIRGDSLLFNQARDIRKVTRTMPAAYELLPRGTIGNGIVENDMPLDIFDLDSWQDNVRIPGESYQVMQGHLTAARAFVTSELEPVDAFPAEHTLQLYGAREASTLRRVEVAPRPQELVAGQPIQRWYDFDNAVRDIGDDVVPLASAWVERQEIPAVRIEVGDVHWSEFLDRMLTRKVSFHAFMPTINAVQTIVGRFFEGANGTDLLPRAVPHSRYTG